MKNNSLIQFIRRFTDDATQLSGAVVYAYAKMNGINGSLSIILNQYNPELDNALCEEVLEYFSNICDSFSFTFLVELLEMLIPATDRKEKGVVYTSEMIKKYIISECIACNAIPTVIDPACGCGSFLVSAAETICSTFSISYCDCIANCIFGVDIDYEAIKKTKLLLSLLAVMKGETIPQHFNLLQADMINPSSLSIIKGTWPNGFDCVIGNPPYVRARNIGVEEKQFLSCWETSSIGNVDLYMPFFEVGLRLLNEKGKLGFITANGYIQGVNGRSLRKYLLAQGFPIKIVDFREAQLFKNVTSYTCVTIIDKSKTDKHIAYTRIDEGNTLLNHSLSKYEFGLFEDGAPWRLYNTNIDNIICRFEKEGTPLSHWKIRNGLATLKNELFFFFPDKEDRVYYYRTYNGNSYRIEKAICIPIVKPNTIKNETELSENTEVAIFPYKRKKQSFSIIEENELKTTYPQAYHFLFEYKAVLDARDKGHGDYPAWYAYGRTQGMNNFGKKLLIPYIAGAPTAVLALEEELLFYCGYALFSDSEEELRIIKVFLESDAFWYYIFHTSKPYSKGYMALAKNYIVRFSIPELTVTEKKYILSSPQHDELNMFIWQKYGICDPHDLP